HTACVLLSREGSERRIKMPPGGSCHPDLSTIRWLQLRNHCLKLMLFQALYEFAQFTRTPWADGFPAKKRLIDSPEFDSGSIHWLVCLDADGRFKGFESLAGVEEFKPVPRTLEPKDSGEVAEFLVEDFKTVFCLGASATEKLTPKGENKHRQ